MKALDEYILMVLFTLLLDRVHVFAFFVNPKPLTFIAISTQDAYDEAKKGFEVTGNTKEKGVLLTKEERAHGSLIIVNELMRSASVEGEVIFCPL